jgi:hypothetical protein
MKPQSRLEEDETILPFLEELKGMDAEIDEINRILEEEGTEPETGMVYYLPDEPLVEADKYRGGTEFAYYDEATHPGYTMLSSGEKDHFQKLLTKSHNEGLTETEMAEYNALKRQIGEFDKWAEGKDEELGYASQEVKYTGNPQLSQNPGFKVEEADEGYLRKLAYDFASLAVGSLNRRKYTKPFTFADSKPEDFQINVRDAIIEIIYKKLDGDLSQVDVKNFNIELDHAKTMIAVSFDTNIGDINVVISSSNMDSWQIVDFEYKPNLHVELKQVARDVDDVMADIEKENQALSTLEPKPIPPENVAPQH